MHQPFGIGYPEQVDEPINRQAGVLHWSGELILEGYQGTRRAA